ncbi:hypothetical protein LTR10_019209 [Elasticomyces elasticus]|uniref:Uncharacterized protein n=1 Tax=Exophiala sideris TaxID=1016849 RepID=A0ABR0JNN0_9EURO|nr:hypothetical protein LTR10_019209 [Elasticomyces elasticus]KAK5038109.1 hypothetical protein LTS07_001578 [Exophiala sideris]KAK5044093.1 hypothetical protein LTR13_000449 [Exophiala sideris]KAK5067593.1 hypothetical protein LTR69_001582 [Exophiala sideris]KAK5184168.1 hypothetical protein LTR44_003674 [Eurotiomycetes sp. CCFEE 6388]
MTKRIKSHPETDASPAHYHFHGSVHTLILNSSVTGLNLPPATSTSVEGKQTASEELGNVAEGRSKRSRDQADIDGELDAVIYREEPELTLNSDNVAPMDNEAAATVEQDRGRDEMSAAVEAELTQTLSNLLERLLDNLAMMMLRRGRRKKDLTAPRGGSMHLIKLPYTVPNGTATRSYTGKLRNLKNVLRKDPATRYVPRLSESSGIEMVYHELLSLLPRRFYTERFVTAILGILSTPKNLFIVDGWEETWKHLSNDNERVWLVQCRSTRWTALCLVLEEHEPGSKRLGFTLYDPEKAFANEDATLAANTALSALRHGAAWPRLVSCHNIHEVVIRLAVCLSNPCDAKQKYPLLTPVQKCSPPDEENCSGPMVLQYLLESRPVPLDLIVQSTYNLREEHFILLNGILRGDGAPEVEL